MMSIGCAYQTELDRPRLLKMTEADRMKHSSTNDCHVCGKLIDTSLDTKDRDHCHLCGRYRGPAHGSCNRNYQLTRDLTIVFHNLRRYDGHFIMQELGKLCSKNKRKIECIAKGLDDYLGFQLVFRMRGGSNPCRGEKRRRLASGFVNDQADESFEGRKVIKWSLRFIDSCQFLLASLESLVEGTTNFRHTRAHFPSDKVELMLRKQVYCYEYFDSFKRFNEKKLPKQEAFYSSLNDEECSDEDYAHVVKLWDVFDMKCLGDLHDLYVLSDVLLLADVMENYRESSLVDYGLDPVHYYTLPSFSWDAFLLTTGVEIELLTDQSMYEFLEAGIRGGISMISHRLSTANNAYVDCEKFKHDPSKPTKYLIYKDVNNLYGWAMKQLLPLKDFRWLTEEEWRLIDFASVDTQSDLGWILEVDLEYPEEIHDWHDAYPMAPEKIDITEDMLSPYAKVLLEKCKMKMPKVQKLVPNLRDKKNYVVHIRNLQLYLKHGLNLKKIHRVLQFQQSDFQAAYIDRNTRLRQLAKDQARSDQCKLMNNAIFGKSMENVRKYKRIELVTSKQRFQKLTKDPLYIRHSVFSEDLVAVHREKRAALLNKPIAIGFSILDISKVLMYEYHYEYMMPKYGPDRARLLFTDTDSLCYEVQTDDIYADMAEDADRFDFSNYDKDHPNYSLINKKVVGKMKDEDGGKAAIQFAGLRSKMYSILAGDKEEKKRAKGVKKYVVKKSIRHEDYVNVIENGVIMRHEMTMFRSWLHQMFTVQCVKVSLSAFDNKRFLLSDGISSYSYGHYVLEEEEVNDEVDEPKPIWRPYL